MSDALPETPSPTLRWHYGPTESDPDPGTMWHYDCGGWVMSFKEGLICAKCGESEDAT